MAKIGRHKFSYAYISKDTGELCDVEISLRVENDKMKILIQSNDDRNIERDLPEILNKLQQNQLLKADISILEDCIVYVKYPNQENDKKVEIMDENFTIKVQ
ncbi:MAG: hypothetical protein GX308_04185 [Epulopiscium sp.]|nr:hypothetical protein [Candidatus Epulonipiscium sp.]